MERGLSVGEDQEPRGNGPPGRSGSVQNGQPGRPRRGIGHWLPWREWAARRTETEREHRAAREAAEHSRSEEGAAQELAERLREDRTASRIGRALRMRPP